MKTGGKKKKNYFTMAVCLHCSYYFTIKIIRPIKSVIKSITSKGSALDEIVSLSVSVNESRTNKIISRQYELAND